MISFTFFAYISKFVVLRLIRIYQRTLSFDHGWPRGFFPSGFCRFQPTCSEYGYRSIERFGVIKGGLIAFLRIIRCNPFSKGGIEDVPEVTKKTF